MAVPRRGAPLRPWAREWLLAEPDSADASVLLALALVHRALRGKEKPARVREACRDAAVLVPDDPTPWLGLLMLERSLGTDEDVIRVFDEVRGRYADHHHAHHLMVARLAERGDGGGPDPLHEVYDFANWAAEQAPPTPRWPSSRSSRTPSATAVLAAAGREPPTRPPPGHWVGRRARLVMKAGLRLVAGVGAGRPPAPADRPQLPRPRQVLRGPRRRGRCPVPPHRRARHPGPVVVPGPRPVPRLPGRARRRARHGLTARETRHSHQRHEPEGRPAMTTGSSSTSRSASGGPHQHLQGRGARPARRPARHGRAAAVRARRHRPADGGRAASCPPPSRSWASSDSRCSSCCWAWC